MMIFFIYFIIMISFIDTFSQLPIISPYAQGLGATPLLIGMVVGIYSFSNIIGNLFAGFWIDRDGAKRVLSVGLGLTGLILLCTCRNTRSINFGSFSPWIERWISGASGIYFFSKLQQ